MTKKTALVFGSIALAVIALCTFALETALSPKPNALRVGYPFQQFSGKDHLIDPANTETIFEYYLLENLSIGLLRDSLSEPSGYKPALAESWHHPDAKTWVFKIKSGIKWSDGSLITDDEIRNWFEYLRKTPAVHHQYLRDINKVEFDSVSRNLIFRFSKPKNNRILYELTLADSTLFSMKFKEEKFRKTTGAYYVEEVDLKASKIVLKRNPHFVWDISESPEVVFMEQRQFLMDKPDPEFNEKFDMVYFGVFGEHPNLSNYEKIGFVRTTMHPTSIHFLHFHHASPLLNDIRARRWIRDIFDHAFSKGLDPKIESAHSQIFPLGFAGHMTNPRSFETYQTPGELGRINLVLSELYNTVIEKQLDEANQKIRKIAPEFQLSMVQPGDQNFNSQNWDLLLNSFRGNQKDPLSSLSFFLNGKLKPFAKELAPLIEEARDTLDNDEFQRKINEIQYKILNDAMIIPLFFGGGANFHRPEWECPEWNPFDGRLRFYDWKRK